MKTSKLISILKTFSEDELKRFEKFIMSPYHNSGRNLKPLFKILKKHHPVYPADKLTEAKILRVLKLPSNGVKTSSQLSVRFSELTKMVKNFIVVESSLTDSFRYSKLLAENYVNKGRFSLCNSETNECIKILREKGLDENYALERQLLQRIISLNYFKENKIKRSVTEMKYIPLYALSYFLTNVKIQLFSNHKEHPVNYEFLKNIVDSIDMDKLAKVCEDDGTGILNKTVYDYKRCQFYLYERTEDFLDLLDYYKRNFEKLSRHLKWQYFLGVMRSGTTLMVQRDYILYGNKLNSLIDYVFGKGVHSFRDEEPIEDVLFTTIVRIKFAIESADKIRAFSRKFLHKVKPELQKRTLNYMNAFTSFKNKDFTKSLVSIQLISSPSLNEKNSLYKLKIAVLYELNYFEELNYIFDSYNHFLSNNKKFKNGENSLNLIDIIKKFQLAGNDRSFFTNTEKAKIMEDSKTSEFHWWIKYKLERLSQ